MLAKDIDNFLGLLESAERGAVTEHDFDYVASIKDKWFIHFEELRITTKQIDELERIAGY